MNVEFLIVGVPDMLTEEYTFKLLKEAWDNCTFHLKLEVYAKDSAIIIRYQQLQIAELQNAIFNII